MSFGDKNTVDVQNSEVFL